MKAASGPLLALLNSGADIVREDLWTITLNGGQVIRWSGADRKLSFGGNRPLGPALTRGAISVKRGLEVATLSLQIIANADDTINGVPIVQFAARHGFDLANVRLDYGYAPDVVSPIVGTLNGFTGRVTSVNSIAGNVVDLTVSAWTVLMDAQMPTNLYQVGCIHTVYDAGCAILASSFSATGTVSGTPTTTAFASGLSGTAGIYAQGRVVFTSGANNGLSATVKSYDGAGNFVLIAPLPAAPAAGDTFTAVQGCDQTSPTCLARFNNLIHFRGFEYIPTPESAL